MTTPPSPQGLAQSLMLSIALLGAAVLVCWGVEVLWNRVLFPKAARKTFIPRRLSIGDTFAFVGRHIAWLIPVTLAIGLGFTWVAQKLGWSLPPQDLILWLADDHYSAGTKALIVTFALLEAPLLEELLFRRFIFRAFLQAVPAVPSFLLSGAVFGLVHGYASIFLPLLFLGSAFAWIYLRTGRLWAPMLSHFLFNGANLILIFMFPQAAHP
ncbi:MAG: lysostaphin resistance A-like protein [Kiritimatiellia bacterium]